MNQGDRFPPPFHLNQWLIQPDLNRITGPEGPVQVEPRVMQVLLALAARPGAVVTRLQLLDEVWGDAVVGEEILTRAVSELRRIFGDKARQPAYIETIRNHGYRLIAPVAADSPATAATAPPPRAGKPRRGFSRTGWLLLIVLLAVLAVAGRSLLERDAPPTSPGPALVDSAPRARPLTSYSGREMHPRLSADGSRVVFAWAGPDGRIDIYVKQRNSESLLRLTDDPAWASWPVWSPDGQSVAYVQGTATGSALCVVPSVGGAVQVLHQVDGWIEGLDWPRVGDALVFAAFDQESEAHRLMRLSLSDYRAVPLGVERADNAGDFRPCFSPDGTRVAWVGRSQGGGTGLFVADGTGGPATTVTAGLAPIHGLAWSPDAGSLIFAASPAGMYNLWQVDVDGGATRWIPTPDDFAWNPTVAPVTGDLAYEQIRVDQDLWRIRILGRDPWQLETGPFLTSTRWEYEADFHPAGDRIVFVSARSGHPELWLGNAEGDELRQLTFLAPAAIGNPRWSPSGDRIAFNLVQDGRASIMVVQARGGQPVAIGPETGAAVFSDWSADGQGLLIGMAAGEVWNICRQPLAGGSPTPLTTGGGLTAAETKDGRFLYFTRPGRPGLWRREQTAGTADGDPELVVPDLNHRDRHNWRLLDRDGQPESLFWVERTAGGAFLLTMDLASRRTSFLTELPDLAGSGLAVSPAGEQILYPRTGPAAGDIMVLEKYLPRSD